MTFKDLGLAESLVRAACAQGYETPFPIQVKAIPIVLQGSDLMAAAQTGTGKTAAFVLPMLQNLLRGDVAKSRCPRALILTPTRELAAQVQASVQVYSSFERIKSAAVFGGVKIRPQIDRLQRGVDVLVATPGRLLDLHNQGAVAFGNIEILVLDEADRMLDMGFIHDIRRIVALLPAQRQTLMFSATFSREIRQLAGGYLKNPRQVDLSPPNATAETVMQWIYPVDKSRKPEVLSHLIHDRGWHQVLVFARTKHGANRLSQKLEKNGINSAAIHGNKTQSARVRALEDFKRGKVQALVATDVAARGLDIAQLPQVVNFDLPNVPEDYVHRIGRTGRAGSAGRAYSLVSADEADFLRAIEQLINRKLPREEVVGFEPKNILPEGRSPEPRNPRSRAKPQIGKDNRGQGNNGGNRKPPDRRRRRAA